jgi:hypothetical protein
MKLNICPICNIQFERLMKHIHDKHKELYEQECIKAAELFSSGLTFREIGDSNLTYWSFGQALCNVIKRKVTAEEMEIERRKRISRTMLMGYEERAYDLTRRGRKKTVTPKQSI